jgi:hypothetical protein
MPYKHVIRLFEERKGKLQDLLESDLQAESKTRIEGAIDEIDFLLSALKEEFGMESGQCMVGTEATLVQALSEEKKAL